MSREAEHHYRQAHKGVARPERCDACRLFEAADAISDFALALNNAPKVAEAPFALTSPTSRATDALQRDLFGGNK